MSVIRGFTTDAEIYRGRTTTAWRAVEDATGRRVILKMLTMPRPDLGSLRRYRNAWAITRGLDLDVVLGPDAQHEIDGRPLQVVADTGLVAVQRVAATRPWDLGWTLRVGALAAEALEQLHGAGVIHRDINATNLLVDADARRLQLIDFDFATRLERESIDSRDARTLQGTLAYIAPEQTGRTNRTTDRRADLYSLGVTLYELLAGRLPFDRSDALAMIHAHLAAPPPPLLELMPDLPPVVAAIVHRLIAKAPEDRYQTAAGLAQDLRACVEQVEASGTVETFPLGRHDVAGRPSPVERLVGRDGERDALFQAHERAAGGACEVALVYGYSGIGKTALVGELQVPVLASRGWFASGKCSAIGGVPLEPLVQAFQELGLSILAEDDEVVAQERSALLEALESLAGIAAAQVPALATVLGELPAGPPLPPAEAQTRLQHTFLRLARAFSSANRPLVLFLDDLQWADWSTLQALRLLMSAPELGHLLVVCSWRDNEVDEDHPLTAVLKDVEQSETRTTRIELRPLAAEHVAEIVSLALSRPETELGPVVEALHARSRGVPLLVHRLLDHLVDEGVLQPDPSVGGWSWSPDALAKVGTIAEAADLLLSDLDGLASGTREALGCLACLGSAATVEELAELLDRPTEQVDDELLPAAAARLVIAVGGDEHRTWRFIHDRVEQAAYAALSEHDRLARHRQIGEHLSGRPDPGVEALLQRNRAAALLEEPSERQALAAANLATAQASMSQGLNREAVPLLRLAHELNGDETIAFDVLSALAEAATVSGMTDDADFALRHADGAASDLESRAQLAKLSIRFAALNQDTPRAQQVGLQALRDIGLDLPEDPAAYAELHQAEMGTLMASLAEHPVPTLVDLPALDDPAIQLELGLLAAAIPAAYSQPMVFAWLCTRMVNLSIAHGNAIESSLAYVFQGVGACMMGQLEVGKAFGDAGLALNERQGVVPLAAPANHMYGTFIDHWFRPYRDVARRMVKARDLALEFGIADTAGYATWNIPWLEFLDASDVGQAIQRSTYELAVARNILRHAEGELVALWTLRQLHRLAGDEEALAELDREGHTDQAFLDRFASFPALAGANLTMRMMTDAVLGNWERVHADAAVVATTTAGPGSAWAAEYPFFAILARVVLDEAGDGDSRDDALADDLDAACAESERLASLNPALRGWQSALLQAERHRRRGELEPAGEAYDRAWEQAQLNQRRIGESIVGPRAAGLWSARARPRMAHGMLAETHYALVRWGAAAGASWIERRHPELRRSTGAVELTSSSVEDQTRIDMHSVLKASRALSTEIVLEDLLPKLVSVVVENAGATSGAIALPDGAGLVLAAWQANPDTTPDIELDRELDPALVPVRLIRQVARSGKRVLLQDVAGSGLPDDTWQDAPPASVLCLPVLTRGRLSAVLYLAHDQATRAFDPDRCALLDMLAAQAAVSIENAQLYRQQQDMVRSMSRFVPSPFLQLLGRESIEEVRQGDAVEREMSVLFADIRQFTRISEGLGAGGIFRMLNRWLERASPVIAKWGGVIDKFMGDGVMALFAEPMDAVGAAIDLSREGDALSAELAEESPGLSFRVGIGVHHGPMILGTVGDESRLDVTVIADAVNVAARLQEQTKVWTARILVSGEVWDAANRTGHVAGRALGRVLLRGRGAETRIYEVLDAEPADERERRTAAAPSVQAALAALDQGDTDSALKAVSAYPEDPAVRALVARIPPA